MGDWNVFVPYTGFHLFTVLVCGALVMLVVAAGRRMRTATGELALRRSIAGAGLSMWVIYNAAWNWNGIDLYEGLPLQLCDVGGLLAPLALLTLNRWLRAALYFWAFTLTTQAFIQPTLVVGPADFLFWCFWFAHTIIVGAAVYDLAVLRFRPDWPDLARAYAVSGAYLAVVIPTNLMLGSNYGYIGNPPPPRPIPPFVDLLGPWPQRAIVLVTMAALGFAVVLLPWALARLARRRDNTLAAPAASSSPAPAT
jgi:hypothetical integral membrane protein (TIGR02206 family)